MSLRSEKPGHWGALCLWIKLQSISFAKRYQHVLTSHKLFISQTRVKTKQELWTSWPLLLSQGDPVDLLCIKNAISPIWTWVLALLRQKSKLSCTSLIEMSNSAYSNQQSDCLLFWTAMSLSIWSHWWGLQHMLTKTYTHIIYSFLNKNFTWKPACGLRASFLLAGPVRYSGILPHSLEQQTPVSLFHQEAQLPECGVVSGATTLQVGNQLLILHVVF